MSQFTRNYSVVAALLVTAIAGAQSGSLNVDTRSNIFGYGVTLPTSGGGGGVLAPSILLSPGLGRTVTFGASGSGGWGAQWPNNGPDGGQTGPSGVNYNTNISGVGPISGFTASLHGHLVGVFVEAGDVSASPAPSAIVYSGLAALGQASYSPGLRQVFFIGDGLTGTGSGSVQVFNVPDAASKLVLGIADANSFSGAPGFYDDNSGTYLVNYQSTPEPSTLAAFALGAIVLVRRRRRTAR